MSGTTVTPPQIVMDGDSARARLSDPVTSHIAADLSALTLTELRTNVLRLVETHGPSVGSELNDRYPLHVHVAGWKRVSFDSPRKRAGELADAGFLARRPMRTGLWGMPETEYALTIRGLEALEMAS